MRNLPAPLLRFTRAIGVDRAVGFTVAGRAWAVLAGPVTLFFVVRFLTKEEQGFYYTFGSILGLQVFFELGLAGVIGLTASHERAQLDWTADGKLQGDHTAKARLASLLRIATAWYAVVALLFAGLVLPVGLRFFAANQPHDAPVEWQLPWILVVLVQVLALFTTPLFAVLEGCGLVAQVALVRLGRAILGSAVAWLLLAFGHKLYAAPALAGVGVIFELTWVAIYKRAFLLDLLKARAPGAVLNWWQDVWPFQWRIAISGMSGYFIFLLFNPVLFAFHGAAAAGRMGLSASIVNTIAAMALAWVGTKAAPFGTLIARREFAELDRRFFPALWQSVAVAALAGGAFWLAAWWLNWTQHPLSQRLLAPLPLGLLVAAMLVNHILAAEAVYLRSHKREPFFILSLVVGILSGASTYFFGRYFGETGMMAGFLAVSTTIGLVWGTHIFRKCRQRWRLPVPPGAEVPLGA